MPIIRGSGAGINVYAITQRDAIRQLGTKKFGKVIKSLSEYKSIFQRILEFLGCGPKTNSSVSRGSYCSVSRSSSPDSASRPSSPDSASRPGFPNAPKQQPMSKTDSSGSFGITAYTGSTMVQVSEPPVRMNPHVENTQASEPPVRMHAHDENTKAAQVDALTKKLETASIFLDGIKKNFENTKFSRNPKIKEGSIKSMINLYKKIKNVIKTDGIGYLEKNLIYGWICSIDEMIVEVNTAISLTNFYITDKEKIDDNTQYKLFTLKAIKQDLIDIGYCLNPNPFRMGKKSGARRRRVQMQSSTHRTSHVERSVPLNEVISASDNVKPKIWMPVQEHTKLSLPVFREQNEEMHSLGSEEQFSKGKLVPKDLTEEEQLKAKADWNGSKKQGKALETLKAEAREKGIVLKQGPYRKIYTKPVSPVSTATWGADALMRLNTSVSRLYRREED